MILSSVRVPLKHKSSALCHFGPLMLYCIAFSASRNLNTAIVSLSTSGLGAPHRARGLLSPVGPVPSCERHLQLLESANVELLIPER